MPGRPGARRCRRNGRPARTSGRCCATATGCRSGDRARGRAARRHRRRRPTRPVPLAGQQVAYRVWYLLLAFLYAAVPAQVRYAAPRSAPATGRRPGWPPCRTRARPAGRCRARRDHHRARVRRAPGVHRRPRGAPRRGHRPALRRADPAPGPASRVRLRRHHPWPSAPRRDAPRHDRGPPDSRRSRWPSFASTGSACPASGRRSAAGWPPAVCCSADAGPGRSARKRAAFPPLPFPPRRASAVRGPVGRHRRIRKTCTSRFRRPDNVRRSWPNVALAKRETRDASARWPDVGSSAARRIAMIVKTFVLAKGIRAIRANKVFAIRKIFAITGQFRRAYVERGSPALAGAGGAGAARYPPYLPSTVRLAIQNAQRIASLTTAKALS